MKLLVTGSTGLVGSACVQLFKSNGWEVVGVDNNMRSHFFGTEDRTSEYEIDIREASEINWLFAEHQFDAIVHAASQPSHDYSKDHVMEDFDINARGTLILLEATRKYCPRATFVYVSTDKVYGEQMEVKLTEGKSRYTPDHEMYRGSGWKFVDASGFKEDLGLDFAGARSPFGCSKAAADIYVQEYGNYFGMKTACFRPGCITGKNHAGAELHGFLAYVAKCVKEGIPYKIFGNGKNVRDQIHANDLASAFFEFIENPKVAAVYNMGGGPERSISVLEALKVLEEETGKKAHFSFYEARKGDRLYDIHDVSKFRNDYPEWKYRYSLQDIIKDLV